MPLALSGPIRQWVMHRVPAYAADHAYSLCRSTACMAYHDRFVIFCSLQALLAKRKKRVQSNCLQLLHNRRRSQVHCGETIGCVTMQTVDDEDVLLDGIGDEFRAIREQMTADQDIREVFSITNEWGVIDDKISKKTFINFAKHYIVYYLKKRFYMDWVSFIISEGSNYGLSRAHDDFQMY